MDMNSTSWITSALYNYNRADINSISWINPNLQLTPTLYYNDNRNKQNIYNPFYGHVEGWWNNYRPTNYYTYRQTTPIKCIWQNYYNANNTYNYKKNYKNNITETKNTKQGTIQEDLRSEFLTTAKKYKGCNESDGSWRQISNSKEWCADFITHVVNETYNDNGYADLKGFNKKENSPHMRVEEIKQWGIKNDKFLNTANSTNKARTIKENVKKGDIVILRENGASHTGFVTEVLPDGSFKTIEGNRDDKVTTYQYAANDNKLSGFVQLA